MERKTLSYEKRESYLDAKMIIIGYEGKDKEPKYFSQLEEKLLEPRKAFIHPLPPSNGESAPKKVLERVKQFVEDPYRGVNIEPGDTIWFVLDVDKYPKEQFDQLNNYCGQNEQRNLAISNPCFEIWLWLHLDDADNISSTNSNDLKKELHQMTTDKGFNGDYTPWVEHALEKATKIDNSASFYPSHKTTKVYLLVNELLKHKK